VERFQLQDQREFGGSGQFMSDDVPGDLRRQRERESHRILVRSGRQIGLRHGGRDFRLDRFRSGIDQAGKKEGRRRNGARRIDPAAADV